MLGNVHRRDLFIRDIKLIHQNEKFEISIIIQEVKDLETVLGDSFKFHSVNPPVVLSSSCNSSN